MNANAAGPGIRTLFGVTMTAAIVIGCGGGGGGGGVTPPTSGGAGNATVKFSVTVPSKAASPARRPSSLSSSAESIVVTLVQAPAPPTPTSVAIDLESGASDCAQSSKGKVCARTMTVPVGEAQFTVFVYSRPGGKGALLAAGAVPPTQVQVGVNADNLTTVLLTLSSIVKSIKLAVTPAEVTVGQKKVFDLILTAYDATGAIVLAPGKYSVPILIELHDSDKFFGSDPPFPQFVYGPRAGIPAKYDGENVYSEPGGGSATFTASGGTLAPASARVTFGALPSPSPSPSPKHSPTPLPTLTPVPTFSPSASPSPPPTPVPEFSISPTTITFAGTAPQPTQTFTASEPGVSSFTATSQNPSIATVSGSGTTFTVTAGSTSGRTLIDVLDPSSRKATVTVIVSGQVIIIQSKTGKRRR